MTKNRQRTVAVTLVILMMSLFIVACPPAVEPDPVLPEPEKVTWRMIVAYAPGSIEYRAMDEFAARIYDRSEGMFEIEYFSGGVIVPVLETLTAVGRGTVEGMIATGAYWRGKIPVGDVELGLPFAFSGPLEQVEELIYEHGLIEIFREAYAEHNAYLVGVHSWSGYPALKSRVPIRTLADFRGVKARAIGAFAPLLVRAGATSVWIPGPELYMALKLGTIDVAGYSIDAVRGKKFYEVMDYLIMPPLAEHSFGHIIVNMDAWNALPDHLKEIFREAEEEYSLLVYREFAMEWAVAIDVAEALGYEVITLPPADVAQFRQWAMEIWDELAARDARSARAIEIIKDFYGIG